LDLIRSIYPHKKQKVAREITRPTFQQKWSSTPAKRIETVVALQRLPADSLADLAAITNPFSSKPKTSFGDLSLSFAASDASLQNSPRKLLLKIAPLLNIIK
jgi:hypothetical protein